jgi:hypothetical protein
MKTTITVVTIAYFIWLIVVVGVIVFLMPRERCVLEQGLISGGHAPLECPLEGGCLIK